MTETMYTYRPPRRGLSFRTGAVLVTTTALLSSGLTAAVVTSTVPSTPPAQQVTVTTPASMPVTANGSIEALAADVKDSVVAISAMSELGRQGGSGVVVDPEGHVLTNHHVVNGAEQLAVSLSDGRLFEAKLVGSDPTRDLAVLKIANVPDDLKPATLGSSAKLQVGQQVVAVGSPLGLEGTVTSGIVSALDRPVVTKGQGDAVVTNAIQIDAAINPGNSGGPLFDMAGNVVGINSSIASLHGDGRPTGSIGLGFAIPIDVASRVSRELIETGKATHAILGVYLSTDAAESADGRRVGAGVANVVEGGAAEQAGMKAGDVVVGINGKKVTGAQSLTGFVRAAAPGDTVKLTVLRDGSEREIEVKLAAA